MHYGFHDLDKVVLDMKGGLSC